MSGYTIAAIVLGIVLLILLGFYSALRKLKDYPNLELLMQARERRRKQAKMRSA